MSLTINQHGPFAWKLGVHHGYRLPNSSLVFDQISHATVLDKMKMCKLDV